MNGSRPRSTSDVADQNRGKLGLSPESIIKWLIAVVVVLVLIIGVLLVFGSSRSTESGDANPGTDQSLDPSPPPTSSPTAQSEYVMDAEGWQDTPARCEAPSRPLETARTADALIVICFTPGGELAYKGVRTSDGDSLVIDEVEVTSWAYFARNEGVHYRVTNTDLTISSGDSLISQLPFIERRGNSLSSERPTATTTPSRQPSSGGRASLPTLPGSAGQDQNSGNSSANDDGYGVYESKEEYYLHFNCEAYNVPTRPTMSCDDVIPKYGPEDLMSVFQD